MCLVLYGVSCTEIKAYFIVLKICVEGTEMVKQVTGIKACTWDEHRVLYVSAESLNCTPETNIILYIN